MRCRGRAQRWLRQKQTGWFALIVICWWLSPWLPSVRSESVVWITDEPSAVDPEDFAIIEFAHIGRSSSRSMEPDFFEVDDTDRVILPTLFQPQAPAAPPTPTSTPSPTPTPAAAQQVSQSLFGTFGVSRSMLTTGGAAALGSADVVQGRESQIRVTTDVGNLLGKTPSMLSVGAQRRSPIVTDPRVRGSRVGAVAASGSFWVPARIDLDTMLSKIDSRIIQEAILIKGPYSALYGPGFEFYDVKLLPAPRYGKKFENHGSTSFDYKENGDNWYGRESVWGGQSNWGYRVSYGHRTGNDYDSGNGMQIPSSYKSRDWEVALGHDLARHEHVDFHYLRLDQTDVELPGQAFDIDWLVTDGYDVIYLNQDPRHFDRMEVRSWYNRTRFEGSAQRLGKRSQFPIFDAIGFVGFTDVDSMSAGYRAAGSWDSCNGSRLTAGADLRYVKQELNELASGSFFAEANSPIPRSHWSNPGIFLEATTPRDEPVTLRFGGRFDWVSADIEDDAAKLDRVTPDDIPYAALVGTSDFGQDDTLWSAFVAADCQLTCRSTAGASFGFAQRSPNLTERYAAEPFMFLLQNGLNTITGAPDLDPERLWQLDVRYQYDTPSFRTGITGFYAWSHDYITFENMSTVPLPPFGEDQVENLKYVNTDLATLAGVEWYGEWEVNRWLTPFATIKYVEGTDQTRNGEFATRQAKVGLGGVIEPSFRDFSKARGYFSGVIGSGTEPLPSILPLESRIGVRLHPPRRVRRRNRTTNTTNRRSPSPSNDTMRTVAFQSEAPAGRTSPSTGSARPANETLSAAARSQQERRGRPPREPQERWGVELSARIMDDQHRVATSLLESPTPGFTVWDIRSFWRPSDNMLLVSGIENFTDKNYREHLDFRAPSTSVGEAIFFQPGFNFYVGGEVRY